MEDEIVKKIAELLGSETGIETEKGIKINEKGETNKWTKKKRNRKIKKRII